MTTGHQAVGLVSEGFVAPPSGAGAALCLKRLLLLAASIPYPPTNGYSIRVWELLRALKAEGCELHLVAFGRIEDFRAHEAKILSVCESVEVVPRKVSSLSAGRDYARRLANLTSSLPYGAARFRSNEMKQIVERWLQGGRIDAVVCEEPYLIVNLPSQLSAPLILDSQNVEHVLIERYAAYESSAVRRAYANLEAKRLLRLERRAWARSSLVLACSGHDGRLMTSICPDATVRVAPNVIDASQYPPAAEGKSLRILYSGGMDWYPNRDAVEFFTSSILPKLRSLAPGVQFIVAGRGPSPEFRRRFEGIPDLEFMGSVPDMRAEIAKAAVCIVPLRIGSGTRLKILEAAAMSKPIVSTRIGAEGLEFEPEAEILLADEPQEFARAVATLLADEKLRESMGHAARLRVERQYSVDSLRTALRDALSSVPAGRERLK